jgi:ubiquinone/menaquinone biosynthesis C-methylase UbiE
MTLLVPSAGPPPTEEQCAMEVMDRAFAAVYARMSPRVDAAGLGRRRAELLATAHGHVLEIGAGTGANLPALQHAGVSRVTLLEPSPAMARHLRAAVADTGWSVPVEVIEAPAEALPVPDQSVDTVVSTLVLCTVPDPPRSLAEIHRVLRPGGTLLLLEHVVADGALHRVQTAIEPVWKVFGRGCHLTRDTAQALKDAGFDTRGIVHDRLPGGGPASPTIQGSARRIATDAGAR